MQKNIIFSSHALERMQERFISQQIVIKAIINPDKIELSSVNLLRFLIKKIYFNEKLQKEHLLMIICEKEKEILKIITVIDTSKISKYF